MASDKTIARIEAAIQRRVAYCLQFEISDPRAGFVTITGAELTPDMSIVKLRWSVLDVEHEKVKSEHMLESARGFVQKQMGRVLKLRRIPRIQWIYDDSQVEAARLDLLIRQAQARDERIRGAHGEHNQPEGQEDIPPSAEG